MDHKYTANKKCALRSISHVNFKHKLLVSYRLLDNIISYSFLELIFLVCEPNILNQI